MEDIQYSLSMEIPYFQTANNIFDLDINVTTTKGNETIIRPIKVHEKLVYIYLCRCANNGRQAFPSYNTIANKCCISRRTAIETIQVLKENKFIVKITRWKDENKQDSNMYSILPPSAQHALPSAGHSPGVVQDMHHPSAGGAPKKELIKKNYFNNNKKNENPIVIYQNNIFPTPGAIDIATINNWTEKLGAEIVIYAINIATKANVRRLNYIEKILMDWDRNGVKTLQQAEAYTSSRNNKAGAKNGIGGSSTKNKKSESKWEGYRPSTPRVEKQTDTELI